MFTSPKPVSIFSFIGTFAKIKYKLENRAVLNIQKKLIIVVTNLLVYYLIVKISYIRLLLINNLIFIGIKFEIFNERI